MRSPTSRSTRPVFQNSKVGVPPFKFWNTGLVEREVGERIRVAVHFSRDVFDDEIGELPDELCSTFEEWLQVRAFHFIAALHLANQQFGIAADAKRRDPVGGGIV